MLGVEGRHGSGQVSPFRYRTMQADPPTTMMMPALGRQHEIMAEAYTDELGRPAARPIRQLVLKKKDGSMQCVPFSRAWTAEQLGQAIKNRGLEGGDLVEIYFDDDEPNDPNSPYMLAIRALLSAVFGQFSAQTYLGSGEVTQNQLLMSAGIGVDYMRAIAKTAFHYFLWSCGELRGDEEAFAGIRRFIREGTGNWRDFVELQVPQFLPVLQQGYRLTRTSHFFFAALTREAATCHVQFFVGPQFLTPPSRVVLALNPLRTEWQHFTLHQACYFADDSGREDGHHGELVSIPVGRR
jgi:hypothetical protein